MTDETRLCPGCAEPLAADVDVCPDCGQEFCPSCLAPIAADAAGCAACGAEFAVVCPQCDEEIEADSERCIHCGFVFDSDTREVVSSRAALTQATLTQAGISGQLQEDIPDGICPVCDEPVFLGDGYCDACETTFCPECVQEIDEDDEVCPHCGTVLYFDCPLCGFELTTGTDLCPSCGALFFLQCPSCAADVPPLADECEACGTELVIEQRESSRVVQTLVVGQQLVRVFACTRCGTQFDSSRPDCPGCGLRVCPNCQLVLKEGEEFCPRCRPDILARMINEAAETAAENTAEASSAVCPTCGEMVESGEDSCAACGQLLCPNCLAAVDEDDWICPGCGAEFELLCPDCETAVEADAEICPHCGASL